MAKRVYIWLALRCEVSGLTRKLARCVLASLTLACATYAQVADFSERFREATEAMRQGRLDEAAAGFSAVTAAAPNFAEAHLNLGLVLEEQRKNEEAIAQFQKALALKPRLRGATLFLGIAQYRLNRLDDAVASFKKETAYYPNDANPWMWLGVAYLAKEQPDSAIEPLEKAAKLDPKNVDILYHRGRAHLLVSQKSYDKMFKADPDSWRVHQVLAQAYAESDRHEQAVAEYKLAIQKAPDQPALHEELGSEYMQSGNPDAALVEFERELQLDPNNAFALLKLAVLAIDRQDGAKAKGNIQSALRVNSNLRDADYYLGRAEMLLGNDQAAIEPLKRAIAGNSDPDIIEQAWYQLATGYRRLHRLEEAKQALVIYQKLKDESAERQRDIFERKRESQRVQGQSPDATAPPESKPR